jgi:hypothetical protein
LTARQTPASFALSHILVVEATQKSYPNIEEPACLSLRSS